MYKRRKGPLVNTFTTPTPLSETDKILAVRFNSESEQAQEILWLYETKKSDLTLSLWPQGHWAQHWPAGLNILGQILQSVILTATSSPTQTNLRRIIQASNCHLKTGTKQMHAEFREIKNYYLPFSFSFLDVIWTTVLWESQRNTPKEYFSWVFFFVKSTLIK